MFTFKNEKDWRRHQSDFLLKKRKKAFVSKALSFVFPLCIAGLLAGGTWFFLFSSGGSKAPSAAVHIPVHPIERPLSVHLSRPEIKDLIRNIDFLNTEQNRFHAQREGQALEVITSLSPPLQKFILSSLKRLKTLSRGKPRRIAIVAMDGLTGRILALAGFDLDDPRANPCLASDYPAASVFKIVTAAAAVDALGYSPQTPLYFNGNKYTLYKRQLKETRNRYTVKTTLAGAFAESVNPVFGKLGKNRLGREKLTHYARAFGFNQALAWELSFEPAQFSAGDGEYHLAELGCGFNTNTEISPLFGALMVSCVLNGGKSLVPSVVDQVKSPSGEVIYKQTKEVYKTPMAPQSAEKMMAIMEKTVSRGTARKAFRGFSRDRILSKLILGGKTGSLYDKTHTVKYDWFTGFGKERHGSRALVVSIVVGHQKYIGTRAGSYGKMIIKQYFSQSPPADPETVSEHQQG